MSELPKQAGILSATEFFRLAVESMIGFALARLKLMRSLQLPSTFSVYAIFSTLLLWAFRKVCSYFLPKEVAGKSKMS
jgi:hypothetical protein